MRVEIKFNKKQLRNTYLQKKEKRMNNFLCNIKFSESVFLFTY